VSREVPVNSESNVHTQVVPSATSVCCLPQDGGFDGAAGAVLAVEVGARRDVAVVVVAMGVVAVDVVVVGPGLVVVVVG
jgi:hypothetical protein